jgi:hypothetical protein
MKLIFKLAMDLLKIKQQNLLVSILIMCVDRKQLLVEKVIYITNQFFTVMNFSKNIFHLS